jgi:ribosome-associated protein
MSIEVQVGKMTVEIPDAELSVRFSRSSGPGGQNVNKTDSRVELSLDIANSPSIPTHLKERTEERISSRLVEGVLTVASSENRSQLKNRQAAEKRMAEVLTAAFAPPAPKRRKTKPSRSAVDKRIKGKKQRGETKRLRRSIDD